MLQPQPEMAGKVVLWLAFAVVFTICSEHSHHPDTSFQADVVCWLVLPLLLSKTKRREMSIASDQCSSRSPSSSILWIIAVCIVLNLGHTADHGQVVFYVSSKIISGWVAQTNRSSQPLLVPLLLPFVVKLATTRQKVAFHGINTQVSTHAMTVIFGFIGSFQTLVISKWTIRGHLKSLPILGVLWLTYASFINGANHMSRFIPRVDLESNITRLSLRVLAILLFVAGLQAFFLGNTYSIHLLAVILGTFKALSWLYVALTVRIPVSHYVSTAKYCE